MDSATAAAPSRLLTETRNGGVTLTRSRPEKRNAVSHELQTQLGEAVTAVAKDASARVVVLAARGPAFCAGPDLGEMVGRSESEYQALFALCSKVMQQLRQ